MAGKILPAPVFEPATAYHMEGGIRFRAGYKQAHSSNIGQSCEQFPAHHFLSPSRTGPRIDETPSQRRAALRLLHTTSVG